MTEVGLKRWLLALTVLVVVDTAALIAVIVRGSPAPPSAPPDGPGQASHLSAVAPVSDAGPADAATIQRFIDDTVEPIQRVAPHFKQDPAKWLPTDEEVQAAVRSGGFSTPAARAVLDKLRAAYEHFGMPFPRLPTAGPLSSTRPDPQAVRAWLDPTVKRLTAAAEERGLRADILLPDPDEMDAAVASGRLDSEATRLVVDRLKASYSQLGIEFPDPNLSRAGKEDESQQILRAWFTVTLGWLRDRARSSNTRIDDLLPTAAEVDAAVATGKVDAPEVQALVDRLRRASERVGLEFTAPSGPSAEPR